jgi:alpha-tubulin suppressor-like RCC1 family protein
MRLLLVGLAFSAGCGGESSTEPTPPAILDPPAGFLRFASISAGGNTVCGLTAEGTPYCWGGSLSDRPRRLEAAPRFTTLDVHANGTPPMLCGLTAEGTAHCHRRGEFVTVASPVPFTTLAAGTASCGLGASGAAFCWAYNFAGLFYGVLGDGGLADGSTYIEGTPVPVAGGLLFDVLASTYNTSCAISRERRAYCWTHTNATLQVGDGTTSDGVRAGPVAVAGGHQFESISTSPSHTCAVAPDGAGYCWGHAFFGELGNPAAPTVPCPAAYVGNEQSSCAPRPVAVAGGHRFKSIVTGGYHTCGLDRDGRAFCWGGNGWGVLGNGRSGPGMKERTPVPVAGDLRFRALAAGEFMTCGIAVSDATYCWGWNQHGQLGAGLHQGEWRTVPHPVGLP